MLKTNNFIESASDNTLNMNHAAFVLSKLSGQTESDFLDGQLLELDTTSAEVKSKVSAKQALKSALDNDEALRMSPEAMVYNLKNDRLIYRRGEKSTLVHRISYTVQGETGPTNPVHYIDAHTGKHILS